VSEAFPSYPRQQQPIGQSSLAPGLQRFPGAPTAAGRRQSAISPKVLQQIGQGARRTAIFSRPKDPDQPIVVVQKDPETTAALEAAVRKVDLFSFLQDDQRRLLVGAMFKKEYTDGEVIIREGDQADNFYILLSGACRVLKKINGVEKQVALLGPGTYFGELALISGSTRAASCIASGELTVCWAIDQATYLGLLREHHGQKRQRYRTLLKTIPLFKALPDYEILLVADALKEKSVERGDVMVKQGDPGEDFFIVVEGEFVVRKASEGGPETEITRLGPGAYFGEVALLKQCPRTATVVATKASRVISLDARSFDRLLGPCKDILLENMKRY
jgi:cAMP-dependent protein kinase regulator